MHKTTPTELLSLISDGESKTVEFKFKLIRDDSIAKTLAAFANTEGGVLFVGVSDSGEISGLSESEVEETLERLHRITISLFPQPVEIGTLEDSGKSVVYVKVENSLSDLNPITTSKGEVYLRQNVEDLNLSDFTKASLTAIMSRNMSHNIGSHTLSYLRSQKNPSASRPKMECRVFVAISFRSEEEPALVDYYRAMERAVQDLKLPIKLIRMDLVEGDFEISQGIMDRIDDVDIVIADFTLNSANVYFELGYARAIKRRIIQTARKGTVLEFDIRNWTTIFYRNATELEEKLKPELQSAYEDVAKRKKSD